MFNLEAASVYAHQSYTSFTSRLANKHRLTLGAEHRSEREYFADRGAQSLS